MKTIFLTMLTVVTSAAFILGAEQNITMEGTLVSSACYLGPYHQTAEHKANGGKQNCGSTCLKSGDPAGLVTKLPLPFLIRSNAVAPDTLIAIWRDGPTCSMRWPWSPE